MTLPLGVIAGATFFLALCPNLGAATGTESPRDLVGVCTSARAEDIAYCEGHSKEMTMGVGRARRLPPGQQSLRSVSAE
jgi:hypothetical protein